MTAVFSTWALVAWGLAAILVSQLLGGTFDTRTCHTDCVQALYWSAFVVTFSGCIAGGWYWLKKDDTERLFAKAGVVALLALLVIFLTTMAIGTFG